MHITMWTSCGSAFTVHFSWRKVARKYPDTIFKITRISSMALLQNKPLFQALRVDFLTMVFPQWSSAWCTHAMIGDHTRVRKSSWKYSWIWEQVQLRPANTVNPNWIVFIVYDLLMPRYTELLTNCLAWGAWKLAVFQHAANVKFPARSRGSGGGGGVSIDWCIIKPLNKKMNIINSLFCWNVTLLTFIQTL